MWGNRFDQLRGIYFDVPADKPSSGGGSADPAKPTTDPVTPKTGDKPVDKTTDTSDDEEDEEDLDLEKLDPKTRKALEKSLAAAEKRALDKKAAEDKTAKEKADADKLASDQSEAKTKGNLQEALTLTEKERDTWKQKYEDLVKTSSKTSDENSRIKIAAEHGLKPEHAKLLGSDPEDYVANAKLLAKSLGTKPKGPNLEGGDNNTSASATRQKQSALSAVKSKFKF